METHFDEIEEEKTTEVDLNFGLGLGQNRKLEKKNLIDLDEDNASALAVPESITVNNSNHGKTPNMLFTKEQIIGKNNIDQRAALNAARMLGDENYQKTNKSNFEIVLNGLSNNLNLIKYQSVLNMVIAVLERHGKPSLAINLQEFLRESGGRKSISQSYEMRKSDEGIDSKYSQYLLRNGIRVLEEKANNVSPKVKQRKPFLRFNRMDLNGKVKF